MSDKDQELINEVSEWENKKFKLEQEKINNEYKLGKEKINARKEMFYAFGRNLKLPLSLLSCFLVTFLIIAPQCALYCEHRKEEILKFDSAMKKCTDKLGFEVCEKIKKGCPGCYLKNDAKESFGKCLKELDEITCNQIREWNSN